MRGDIQFNLRRPPNALAFGLESRLAERQLDAMKQAPQSRAAGLTGTLGPQQRGYDVPCHGAPGLGEIDHERKTLAQLQLDRAVVIVDLRKPERLKREPSHESSLALSECPGDAQGDCPVVTAASDLDHLTTRRYRARRSSLAVAQLCCGPPKALVP